MNEAWPEWPVCSLAELGDPDARDFLVGDGEWPFRGFVLQRDGALHAYANICPHRRHPLDFPPGRFLTEQGKLIRCGSHGALFLSETGECVFGPCVGQSLLKLDLRVEAGTILVRAPDSLQGAGPIAGTI